MKTTPIKRRLALGSCAAALLVATLAGPAVAANTVTQTITGGARTASIANLTLSSAAFQSAAHAVSGTMTLSVDDATDTSLGWGVTIQTSNFVWVGTATGGADIPAAAFAVTSAAAPTWVAGQAVNATAATGPQVATTFVAGTLDSPRRTLEATAAYGAGSYTQALGVTLTIPAMSHVGTYTGTISVTFVAAP
jgi:hypothetical protein